MVLVRPQDLSFMAGGAVAAREGVFVRRTSPTEDVAEIFTRSTVAPRFDENGVVRSAAIDTPRLNWRDFDRDGVYEQAVLPIHPQSINVVEFNVPGGTPADFELLPVTVTNQTDEFYVMVDAGDSLQLPEQTNWDRTKWLAPLWTKPPFSSDDGALHTFFEIQADANNFIRVSKTAAGLVELRTKAGGTEKSTTLTPDTPWSAGDEIFIGLLFDGTDATLYFDTDGDTALDSAQILAVGVFAPGTYVTRFGMDFAGANPAESGLNLALLNIASSAAPLTSRWGAGVGLDIKDWFAEVHPDSGLPLSDHLVYYTPKSDDGEEVKNLNFDGETYLVHPGTAGAYAWIADAPSLDVVGDLELQWFGSLDDWTPAAAEILISKSGAAGQQSFKLDVLLSGALRLIWSEDGTAIKIETSSAATGVSDGVDQWIKVTLEVDNGAADAEVKFYLGGSGPTPSWGQLGATQLVGATTSIFASTANVHLGINQGAFSPLAGKTRRAMILDGIGGTVVLDADFLHRYPGIGSFIDGSAYAHAVTIAGDAALRSAGNQPTPDVFVRADTARQVSIFGDVDQVESGVLRNAHYEGADRLSLLEAAYTNLMTEKDLDSWTKVLTPVLTAITGPDGVAGSAFTVEDDDGGNKEYIFESITLTGDGLKTYPIAVRENTMPGAGTQRVALIESVTGALLDFDITSWVAGEPQVTEVVGTLLDKYQIGTSGWWVLVGQTTFATAVNAHQLYIFPTDTAAQTGSIDVFFPAAYDAAFPPRSLLDASEVTTADQYKKAITGWTPGQGYTLYGKIKNFMLANTGGTYTVCNLGNAAAGGDSVRIIAVPGSDIWQATFRLAANANVGGANAPTIGDDFEFRISVPPTGGCTLGVSKNGGAEDTTVSGDPGAWGPAFNSLFFYLSMDGGPGNQGNAGHYEWKAFAGAAKSLADCRADDADLFHYRPGQFDELAEPAFSTATKGTALPMIDGLGGAWGVADASSVSASGEGIPLPFDTDFGTTIVKLESGPAGSGTRRYLIGLPGTMNGFSAEALAGMVVGVYIPSSSEIDPTDVGTHAVDNVGSDAGDVAGLNDTWEWLWVARTWDAGATEAYFELRFADGVSLSGSDEVIYMAVPTAVAGGVPLVPVPQITEGTTTIEEEDFYAAFEVPPGAMGIYVKARFWAPGTPIFIGQSGGGGAGLRLQYISDGTCSVKFDNGPTTRSASASGPVSPGDIVQLFGTMTDDGEVRITMKIGDAAEEQSALSASNIMVDDWGDQRSYLGSKGGGEHGAFEILYAKIVRGSTYTLAEVEAVQ